MCLADLYICSRSIRAAQHFDEMNREMKQMKTQRKLHTSALAIASLALLSGLSTATNAQSLDRENLSPVMPSMISPALEGQGKLVFASKTQDTGEILDTDKGKVSFLFRNTGSAPLTITQVKPSCGCTVPELAKKTYMPGEQGSIEVTFDPKGKKGAISRNITVYTDSDITPSLSIVVRSLVKAVIITEPKIMPFDAVVKGNSVTKDFKVFGRIDGFKVTRATVDDTDSFSIEVLDGGQVEREGEMMTMQIIRLTLKDTAKPDNHRAQITVRTNDERKPIYSLAAVARVLGDLKMNPVRVTMGRMVVGDEFEREFHVISKSGSAFTISSAVANSIAIEANYTFTPVDEELRNDWIVKITGKVVNSAARFNTQLHIVTDVEDEEQLTVQMYGQLRRE
ncbi:hypothetical protein COB72_06005 [bacterium]|nr:MAG: hypothetical protein COB72_06005 [bacterium]